jgi:5'-3' exonuclease
MTTLLIDGDMLAYRICSAAEEEIRWDSGYHTLHSDGDSCCETWDRMVSDMEETLGADSSWTYFSLGASFRTDYFVDYKSNRRGKRKPLAYPYVVEHVAKSSLAMTKNTYEADDLMGIYAGPDSIICSGDKDMKQIAGRHYDFTKPDLGMTRVTQQEADELFWVQALTGDRVDGYPGCPGMGPKTARKQFDIHGWNWMTVVNAYAAKDLDEEYALSQARCARILRTEDYCWSKGEMIPWTPEQLEVDCGA